MNLGKAIKELRIIEGFNQGDFASKCGISQTSISKIENGSRIPNPKTIAAICKALEIPESILYLKAQEEKDIPENKRNAYRLLLPAIEHLIDVALKGG